MVIAFFGHAHYFQRDDDERKILYLLKDRVEDEPSELYFGGYGQFDSFAARCGRKYKQEHPNTRLIFITPYITVEYQKNQLEYARYMYDDIIYPALERVPLRFAIPHRNRWMAESADLVICYVNCTWGGAYKACLHAKKKGKEIINLAGMEI